MTIFQSYIKAKMVLLLILLFSSFSSFSAPGSCVNLSMINQEFFNESLGMVWHPSKDSWIVWEKGGVIHNLNPNNGFSSVLADLSKNLDTRGDGGLKSMAFHPKFPSSPFIFVTRTILLEGSRVFVLERYKMEDYEIDTENKAVMLKIVMSGLENVSGHIEFDINGFLLMAVGDGSNGDDIEGHGSNPHTLLGTLLRLGVSGQKAVAAINNPFADLLDGAKEVYAYGFRNPHHFSVDKLTGDIWLADKGKRATGEINLIIPKYFYGWSCRDGKRIISNKGICSNDFQRLEQLPSYFYTGRTGRQIVGGRVYRGVNNKDWYGKYFFADYVGEKIWTAELSRGNRKIERIRPVYYGPTLPTSFAENSEGELFMTDFQGRVFELKARRCNISQKLLIR